MKYSTGLFAFESDRDVMATAEGNSYVSSDKCKLQEHFITGIIYIVQTPYNNVKSLLVQWHFL